MSDQEYKDLNLLSLKSETGLYCHQCRKCIPECPNNLEIPAIMRSYMYAYGYRNLEQAHYTLKESGISGNPCEKCEGCSVNCTAGFNVKEKILDISRLKDVPLEFLKS
jgi:predicted aldo/keto reductase-like oxidoreductase